jgi:hypothetical protein
MQSLVRAFAGSLALALVASCGGGGGGGSGPLSITTTTANDGIVGVAYIQTVAATGGNGMRTFSVSAGALPAGLTLSGAGVISGTPAGPAGSANFTVSVTDTAKQPATDTQALSIDVVDPLVITTTTLPATTVGAAYSAAVVVTGGTPAYAFGIGPGSLPSGLGIGADGVIAGPVAPDARSEVFSVFVDDDTFPPQNASQEYQIDVDLEITTTALPDATGGEAYAASLEAQGGLLPLAWSLTAGALPAGLTGPDAASGTIGGTPDPVCVAANAVLTAQVVDSDSPAVTDTQAGITLTLNPAALDISTTALPNGTLSVFYSAPVNVSGGVPPYSFAITAGTLPSQLAFNAATGQITGTPDTVETQAFDVTVTDACPNTVTRTLGITISVSLGRNDTIADATVLSGNGTYSASISPSGHPNTVYAPDEDYYAITTTAASTVTVDINAAVNGSPLDSVIEIVDVNGLQLSTCLAPAFVDACAHDDEDPGIVHDSLLQLQVASATTFYIHVVDWSGNARPDKLYDLVISGVN